ncbi:hypothetical protein JW898_01790 [Candidatus Woesearchaeota archaeon]|nr:hypothetical protein [Candidatus Woesearchaeota archaeon]
MSGEKKHEIINTPLYVHLRDIWHSWLKLSATGYDDLPEEGARTLKISLDEGVVLTYQQARTGDERYMDMITVKAGEAEKSMAVPFLVREDGLYYAILLNGPVRSRKYDKNTINIPQMIEDTKEEGRLRDAADRFSKGFAKGYEQFLRSRCQYVFMFTGRELAYLGDSEVLKSVREGGNLEKSLKDSYFKYRFNPEKMNTIGLDSLESALEYFPEGECSALFTREQHALKLIWMSDPDLEHSGESILRIGGTEIFLVDHNRYMDAFIETLFIPSVYDVVAKVLNESRHNVLSWINAAEESNLVKRKEQIEGIRKAIERETGDRRLRRRKNLDDIRKAVALSSGKTLEDVLGIEATDFFERASSEFHLLKHELMVYNEMLWWEVVKESVGMLHEGSLAEPLREEDETKDSWEFRLRKWNERQPEWKSRFVEAYSLFHPQLSRLGKYDLFIYITPERLPSDDEGRWAEKRRGIGNMVIDFGNDEISGRVKQGIPDQEVALGRLYDDCKGDVNISLFRGRIMKHVLRRMFRQRLPEGGRIAVAACDTRMQELKRFCDPAGEGRLLYRNEGRDVEIVLLSRPESFDEKKRKMIL